MATRTSILGSSGTAERILAPCRFTRIVSAAPLTCDPSLFWPETANASDTRTRELLRPRSCGMSCGIFSSKTELRYKETIEPAASSSYITVNSALPIPKRNGTLSQGNLAGQYLRMFQSRAFQNSFDLDRDEKTHLKSAI
jgi:hypothetical protein